MLLLTPGRYSAAPVVMFIVHLLSSHYSSARLALTRDIAGPIHIQKPLALVLYAQAGLYQLLILWIW